MIIALLFTVKTVVNGIGSNQTSTQMLYKFPYNNNSRINYVINSMGCVAKSYNNQVCYCKARKHKTLFPVTHNSLIHIFPVFYCVLVLRGLVVTAIA